MYCLSNHSKTVGVNVNVNVFDLKSSTLKFKFATMKPALKTIRKNFKQISLKSPLYTHSTVENVKINCSKSFQTILIMI